MELGRKKELERSWVFSERPWNFPLLKEEEYSMYIEAAKKNCFLFQPALFLVNLHDNNIYSAIADMGNYEITDNRLSEEALRRVFDDSLSTSDDEYEMKFRFVEISVTVLREVIYEARRNRDNYEGFLNAMRRRDWVKPEREVIPNISYEFTADDMRNLVEGLSRFGTDFERVAEFMQTKTANLVKAFYLIFRQKYRLDEVLPKTVNDDMIPQNC